MFTDRPVRLMMKMAKNVWVSQNHEYLHINHFILVPYSTLYLIFMYFIDLLWKLCSLL